MQARLNAQKESWHQTTMKTMNTETPSAMPLVSIIIPFYNAAEHLKETLDCVCEQSYSNLEIILVDDGSRDETLSILHRYADQDKRIQVLTQQNEYAGAARNKGMQIATGQYYLFLDGDDIFERDMVRQMVERAEETQADVVICQSDVFTEPGRYIGGNDKFKRSCLGKVNTHHFCVSKEIPFHALQFCKSSAWDKLYRASYVKQHGFLFAPIHRANDAPFVLPAGAAAGVTSILEGAPLVHYRRSATQLSSVASISKDPLCILTSCSAVYDKIVQLSLCQDIKDSCCCWMADNIAWTIKNTNETAREELIRQIRTDFEQKYHLSSKLIRIQKLKRFRHVCRKFKSNFAIYLSTTRPELTPWRTKLQNSPFINWLFSKRKVAEVPGMKEITVCGISFRTRK